jgi:hypothetical protein
MNGTKGCTVGYKKTVVLKVKVKAEGLRGCDKKTAVFDKIEILEGEWNKVMKKKIR